MISNYVAHTLTLKECFKIDVMEDFFITLSQKYIAC